MCGWNQKVINNYIGKRESTGMGGVNDLKYSLLPWKIFKINDSRKREQERALCLLPKNMNVNTKKEKKSYECCK